MKEFRKSTDYYIIYNKYFKNRNSFSKRKKSDYLVTAGGNISPYDDLIKELAITIGWDWRLLASQVYQESMFDPDAQSWVGAKGLMQLMPATAEIYGVVNPADPIQNLKGGVKYIQFLDRYWEDEIADAEERIKFILASFNIGPGHIVDARNLAIKYESNPNLWFGNVENYLLKKSNEKYYDDEVVKHGFARGRETVKYVREVMERFEHYKQLTELARQVKSNEAKIDIKSSKK
ncbi:MAG: transglycosylase SLT domain-containing protein [Melioribacteraceae bacterium]|nr:transglycosylase SLT domain-containing protein [Melioribacteraceae bacterium]MCF8266081.1 transglycosylase SLT domain-containing protein [Melioribacteraceae bacterium]MCF8412389.1 transglycosylase SLT domain-containing protein [Melioribacteraceae bacterium]MCF8431867.1 transglycosylase SLT domain-containing protein [Melioribacteraceae bacterium]